MGVVIRRGPLSASLASVGTGNTYAVGTGILLASSCDSCCLAASEECSISYVSQPSQMVKSQKTGFSKKGASNEYTRDKATKQLLRRGEDWATALSPKVRNKPRPWQHGHVIRAQSGRRSGGVLPHLKPWVVEDC